MKQKIITAGILGMITTGIMSFVLVAINAGFQAGFLTTWAKSWLLAYVIVVPVILVIAPRVQAAVARFFADNANQNYCNGPSNGTNS